MGGKLAITVIATGFKEGTTETPSTNKVPSPIDTPSSETTDFNGLNLEKTNGMKPQKQKRTPLMNKLFK